MDRAIRAIEWQRPTMDAPVDVTDQIESGVLSATPHPDDDIDEPKGYSVKLTLKPDSTAFAEALQEALLDMEPATVTVQLEGIETPFAEVPVSASKVPYPGKGDGAQNRTEMGVRPEAHGRFHEYFVD